VPTWWLYLVLCKDQSVCTGITMDVAHRLSEHRD
jgi:predicted GIY-YIG superfamily endonuclease